MTGRCGRGRVLMRLAGLRASVEHNRQRRDRQSKSGGDRDSYRTKHDSILPRVRRDY